MNNTLEELLRASPFEFVRDYVAEYAVVGDITYTYANGDPMPRRQWYWQMKKDEPMWDKLTLEMAQFERNNLTPGETLPDWLKKSEFQAFQRCRASEVTA